MLRPNRKELFLWLALALLIFIPATLIWMRFKAASTFVDRSSEIGYALMWRMGLYSDSAYQERGETKPVKMDCVQFLQQHPYHRLDRYYFHTNLFVHNPTDTAGISVIIEEQLRAAPGPFFLRPLLPLVGWKPRRHVIYNNGTMRGAVFREFATMDLSAFVSSESLLSPNPK